MSKQREILQKVLRKLSWRELSTGLEALIMSEQTDEETVSLLTKFLYTKIIDLKAQQISANEMMRTHIDKSETDQKMKDLEEVEGLLQSLSS